MSLEPPSSPDSLPRKRKRSSESEVSFSTSLTALSSLPLEPGPLTPVSSYSTFSLLKQEYNPYSIEEGSVDARNSFSGEDNMVKRQFMSPRRRQATMFSNHSFSSSPRPGGLISRVSSFGSSISMPQSFPAEFNQQCHICKNSISSMPESPSRWPNCRACNQTSCFICIRKCQGPCHSESLDQTVQGSHFFPNSRDVCAHCCLEVGYEGIVWCNQCYSHEDQNHERGRYTVGKNKKEMQSERIGMVTDWLSHCSN